MTERESIRLNNAYLKALKANERLHEVAYAISKREGKQPRITLASRMLNTACNVLCLLREA